MPNVEFAELKAKTQIMDVVAMLGLELKPDKDAFRGKCPMCNNPRTFVATPGKGWYCHGRCKTGGDIIKLVAAVRRIEPRAAALQIQEHFGTAASGRTVQRTRDSGNTDRATQLARVLERLQPEHEAIQALGISPETATLFESGYNPSGVQAKRYSVAIRDLAGNLVTFAGIGLDDQSMTFSNFDPEGAIFNANRWAEGTELLIFRSVIDAILAVENGAPIESVAAFLSETISPNQLDLLSQTMLQKQVSTLLL